MSSVEVHQRTPARSDSHRAAPVGRRSGRSHAWFASALLCTLAGLTGVAAVAGQRAPGQTASKPASAPAAASTPAASQPAVARISGGARDDGPRSDATADQRDPFAPLRPALNAATLTWFAVVLILVLVLQTRPLLSFHNLDGLILAATGVLLALRGDASILRGDPTGFSLQQWAYLLLSIAAVYWFARGLYVMRARNVPPAEPNVSEGSMLVLIAACLAVAFTHLATAPVSAGSRDGIVGGLYLLETGRMPYGQTPGFDSRSPLLYALHAGVLKFMPLFFTDASGRVIDARWTNHDQWLHGDWVAASDTAAATARLVNALLLILTLGALKVIGTRLHSVAIGLTLLAIFCVFPGSYECFARPEIMLATALLAWTIAAALLPGLGGLLALLLATLAGVAWGWTWLVVPVLLAYFLRRGWNGVGATVGLLAGAAACLAITLYHVAPALPRSDGALRAAGIQTTHVAGLSPAGQVTLSPGASEVSAPQSWLSGVWFFMLGKENLSAAATDGERVLFRKVSASGPARDELQRVYGGEVEASPELTRVFVHLRTMLEAIWLPAGPDEAGVEPAWQVWTGGGASRTLWVNIRRGVKALCVVVVMLVCAALLTTVDPRPHQLIGALALVLAPALIASELGAVTNWVWLMPVVLSFLAAHGAAAIQRIDAARIMARAAGASGEPAPRISVNK